MNRLDYLETRRGQSNEYWKRQFSIVYLRVEQEPKSKTSIKPEEARIFREVISQAMKKSRRRRFRGDIVLEFNFYTTKNNPPAVQSLSKNYLDLLHKEMPYVDNKKGILFHDDDQVKVLVSNFHLDHSGDGTPAIAIRAYRLSSFIKDVELTQRIKQNRFANSELDDGFKSFDDFENDDFNYYQDDPIKELRKLDEEKDNDLLFYKFHKRFLTRQAQEQYLKRFSLSHFDLISLYHASFDFNRRYIDNNEFQFLWSNAINLISITTNLIELGSPPLNSGDSKKFREKLELKLKEFRSRFKILFPLLHPIGVTIFYTPPLRSVLDLDNLARKIVPLLVELFTPPSDYRLTLSEDMAEQFRREFEFTQKFPKNGITNYQIIHIKRTADTPDEGIVDFFITDGLHHENNIWQSTDNLINKWKQ